MSAVRLRPIARRTDTLTRSDLARLGRHFTDPTFSGVSPSHAMNSPTRSERKGEGGPVRGLDVPTYAPSNSQDRDQCHPRKAKNPPAAILA